jgi:hypothetical protein
VTTPSPAAECTALLTVYQLEGQVGDPSVSLVYNVMIISNGSQLVAASGQVPVPVTAGLGHVSTGQALTDAVNEFAAANKLNVTEIYTLPEWRLL